MSGEKQIRHKGEGPVRWVPLYWVLQTTSWHRKLWQQPPMWGRVTRNVFCSHLLLGIMNLSVSTVWKSSTGVSWFQRYEWQQQLKNSSPLSLQEKKVGGRGEEERKNLACSCLCCKLQKYGNHAGKTPWGPPQELLASSPIWDSQHVSEAGSESKPPRPHGPHSRSHGC